MTLKEPRCEAGFFNAIRYFVAQKKLCRLYKFDAKGKFGLR